MEYDYLGTDLSVMTAEDVDLVKSVREFAGNVMRPIATELDRMTPDEVIAPDSPLWTYKRQVCELGYHRMGILNRSGPRPDADAAGTVLEELPGGALAWLWWLFWGRTSTGA